MASAPEAPLTAPGEERRDDPISIRRLTELAGWSGRLAELDPIFFEASLTKSFAGEAARRAFHERWLGRFLARWPELAHVALSEAGPIVGYIVGAHADPARDPAFADIGFYRELAHLTPQYPAHLHINLAPAGRSRSIGSSLVEAFMGDARRAGVAGVHLVTGRDSRNRSFYARNGFRCAAELAWAGTPIVMLARTT
jgi:GNAT superfamily N-acetyltransferase